MSSTSSFSEQKFLGLQFQQDLAIQKKLKSKHFANSESCHVLLNVLFNRLNNNDPFTVINRSSSGCTGFTFLGQIPSYAVEKDENVLDQRIGFVIKWQGEGLCNVERIGALFYQAFGFPAPPPYQINSQLANQLGQFAEKKCPAMGATYKELTLIAMPLLDANNFKEASKSKLKQLSCEGQQIMLQKFGEIALLDLILGNNDRFISFTDDVENPFSSTSSFNSGNIMMEFEELEDGNQKLLEVYPIDNCTLDLADKKTHASDPDEDMGFDLFDDVKTDLTSKPDLIPSKEISPESIPQADDPEIQFRAKIVRLNCVCNKLISDLDCIATHVQHNIMKDLKEHVTDLEEYQKFIEMAPEHLVIGMKLALDNIKKFDCGSFLKKFEGEKLDAFSRRALELISMNVASFQKNQN